MKERKIQLNRLHIRFHLERKEHPLERIHHKDRRRTNPNDFAHREIMKNFY